MIITLSMVGFWLDHYEARLKEATDPREIQFLTDQAIYYRHRYDHFLI